MRKIKIEKAPSLFDDAEHFIGIGFCQTYFYKPHVWAKAKRMMDILVTTGTVEPWNFGRGKGKFKRTIELSNSQMAARYLLAKYGVVFGIESGFIPLINEYGLTGEECYADEVYEKLQCEDISEVAEIIETWNGFSEPYFNPVAAEDGIVLYHDGERLFRRLVKAGENWLPIIYQHSI